MSPTRQNILFISVLALLGGGFAAGLLLPGLRELERTRQTVRSAAARLRAECPTGEGESEIYRSILQLTNELRGCHERIPPERQFGEFLNAVSESLREIGISDYDLRPLPEHPLNAVRGIATTVIEDEPTFVLPVRLRMACTFLKAFDFLERINQMKRVARVAAIRIDVQDKRGLRVSVDLLLEAYYCPEHDSLEQREIAEAAR